MYGKKEVKNRKEKENRDKKDILMENRKEVRNEKELSRETRKKSDRTWNGKTGWKRWRRKEHGRDMRVKQRRSWMGKKMDNTATVSGRDVGIKK